jgi:DNA-binding NarL/FixJ family response regulator
MKRIYLIDDHPMMRVGLRDHIDNQHGWQVCGEATTAAEAITEIPELRPDLVVVDLTLPDRSGLELVKDLRALMDDALLILMFSMHDETLYAERVLRAGAQGYLMKGAPPDEIDKALRTVLEGGVYLSPKAARHVLKGSIRRRDGSMRSRMETLTDRELEVFQLLGQGQGNSEIASHLNISSRTVDTHRTNIRSKLGLPDSIAVFREAVLAVELGK